MTYKYIQKFLADHRVPSAVTFKKVSINMSECTYRVHEVPGGVQGAPGAHAAVLIHVEVAGSSPGANHIILHVVLETIIATYNRS